MECTWLHGTIIMVSQETNPCSQVKKSCVLIKWRTESFDENHFLGWKCFMLSLRTSAHMIQGHLIPHKLVLKPWRQGIWFEESQNSSNSDRFCRYYSNLGNSVVLILITLGAGPHRIVLVGFSKRSCSMPICGSVLVLQRFVVVSNSGRGMPRCQALGKVVAFNTTIIKH